MLSLWIIILIFNKLIICLDTFTVRELTILVLDLESYNLILVDKNQSNFSLTFLLNLSYMKSPES